MEIEQIKLNGDERLIDALKSRGYKDIPSNVILDKTLTRSEERRVGKECRSRWSPYH